MAQVPEGVAPGKPVWVGLQLAHKPGWHTYWKNAGDSGLPTQLQWTLPAGVTAGEIAWPVPKKIPVGNLANYGYEGTVLLPVPLTVGVGFKPSLPGRNLEVKVHANWLVCKKECIPEEGDFALKIPVGGSTALNAPAFDAAFKAQPEALDAASRVEIDGDAIKVTVAGLPAAVQGKTLGFFPESVEVIETAAPVQQAWQGANWTGRVPLSLQRSQSPAVMPIVLTLGNEGWRTEAKVASAWPAVAAAAGVSPALENALRTSAPPAPPLSLWAALAGALLGGLILNLMPCVFPILAIKVMGFTRHADDVRAHRTAGLAYSAGVVASFLVLGALIVGLRAAGEQLGWGFQLQSPVFVALLAALFTLIGLNLAGMFEFGRFVPQSIASHEAKHPVVNAFLSGVLAVAIASPCTAPFMGASLGYAIAVPASQSLLVFLALGAGMALPYLAASWLPMVARVLPKPGAWMDVFRKLMAFPMFATVAWLVWVVGQQAGIDGAGTLLGLLVALAMVMWALTLHGSARRVAATIAIVFLAALAWAGGESITKPASAAPVQPEGAWQPWEPGRVEQVVSSGQPVFVDFTAAWCVTCQFNKRTVFSRADVMGDFAAKKVALLRADWTRRDPAITAALAQLGREGVPVYVFYSPGKAPVILSELLDAKEVKDAIAKL
ncbi:MAG TPA: thioredoxin family protein [Ramlibacter sp.]|nr:thioredoxin family protein [Ramlibacter sp.]